MISSFPLLVLVYVICLPWVYDNNYVFAFQKVGPSPSRKLTLVYRSSSLSSISLNSSSSSSLEEEESYDYDIGICSIDGVDYKRPSKVNQDAYFQTSSCGGSKYVLCCGIFDGHGKHGHDVTKFMSQNLPEIIQQQLVKNRSCDDEDDAIIEFEKLMERLVPPSPSTSWSRHDDEFPNDGRTEYDRLHKDIHKALVNSFHSIHYTTMQDPSIKSGRSGSTCIVFLIENADKEEEDEGSGGRFLHVASVGDSRAILITTKDCGNEGDTVNVRPLTVETTVNKMPMERERVELCEGTIRGRNVFYGPVGIAMTRSLGDSVMLRAGVIPTPIVDTYYLKSSAKQHDESTIIILATDGVWDVLSNEQVADIVLAAASKQGKSDRAEVQDDNQDFVQVAANGIADAAKQRWLRSDLPINDEPVMDDTTVMVIRQAKHC